MSGFWQVAFVAVAWQSLAMGKIIVCDVFMQQIVRQHH